MADAEVIAIVLKTGHRSSATDSGGEKATTPIRASLQPPATASPDSRSVNVVGPDGRIAGMIPQFAQVAPVAYEELAAMVDEATPEP